MFGRFLGELKRRNVIRVAGVYVVTAWGVFQIAKTVFETLSVPRWASPLVLVLLALGLPITLIISWAFERAPDGSVQRTRSAKGRTRLATLDMVLLGAIVVVLGISVAQIAGLVPAGGERATVLGARAPDKSVAVLPFANFSSEKEADYFADGLTEEVINSLAQVPDLKVAGRTSAFYFKGRNEDVREVGRKLGVAHVVEGSVRRSGDNLRVTAQLISVRDGFHLWSKTYDRKMDDAFAIQTEIANAVAEALKAKLDTGSAAKPVPRDPEAYRLQLTARAHLRRISLEDLTTARKLYERLTALEPENASAWAGYAQATMLLAQNYLALDFGEARRVSDAALARAEKLDPKSVEVWIAKAVINRVLTIRLGAPGYQRDQAAAIAQALKLDPRNAEALTLNAVRLSEAGRHADAIKAARASLAVDPLNRFSQMILASALRNSGRFEEGAAQYRAVIALYPDFGDAKQGLGELYAEQGRLDLAEPWLKSNVAGGTDPSGTLQLAHLYVNLGLLPEAEAAMAAIKTPPASLFLKAAAMAARGDYEQAFAFGKAQAVNDSDSFWPLVIIIGAQMTDRQDEIYRQVQAIAPQLLSREPEVGVLDLQMPLAAAHALRARGDPAQADRILRKTLALTATAPGEYVAGEWRVARIKAYAELGDKERALAELQGAVQAGWRTPFEFGDFTWLDQHPTTRNLHADPRFKALMTQVRADLAKQRAAVLAARR